MYNAEIFVSHFIYNQEKYMLIVSLPTYRNIAALFKKTQKNNNQEFFSGFQNSGFFCPNLEDSRKQNLMIIKKNTQTDGYNINQ